MSTLTVKELAAPSGYDLQMPAGSVLQVVNMTYSTTQSISSTSWADTGLTLAITPKFTSSKIRIDYQFYNMNIGSSNAGISFRITRNGGNLHSPNAGYGDYSGASGGFHWGRTGIAIDSPSSTSALTYTIQARSYNTTAVTLNSSSAFEDVLILTEIAG